MNKILEIVIISLFFSYSATGQSFVQRISITDDLQQVDFNPLCFILGTLSDYMGRFTYVNKPDQVDRYYPDEKPLMDFVDSVILKYFRISVTSNERNETFSKEMARKINMFYGNDKLFIADLFSRPDQICSFLMGKYYREGRRINDTLYVIQMANSPNHKICDILLRRSGCTSIRFRYRESIPAQFSYYFVPTEELSRYFDAVSSQKEILEKAYYKSIRDKLGKKRYAEMQKAGLVRYLSRYQELADSTKNDD